MTTTQKPPHAGHGQQLSWLVARPIAHRGLHDKAAGIYENTLGAARRAVERDFAIEVDLQYAADGVPVVFHDSTLDRFTARKGNVRALASSELGTISVGGSPDTIPTLRQLLELVAGRVPLVLELKGIAGEDEGFVAAVARELDSHEGPAAIMSFNHWLLEDARRLAPHLVLGLTAEGNDRIGDVHREIVANTDPDFVSYSLDDLPNEFVRQFRSGGKPVITWTVRTPEQAAFSAMHADQITFEGFDPDHG